MHIRTMMIFMAFAMLMSACGGGTETADTEATSATEATMAPTEATTATTAPTTTTAAPTTTTEAAPAGRVVDATPVVGVLGSYNPEGEALFVSNSVEAHWYQWDGFYVVLYRGFDASAGVGMCPGNSIQVDGQWVFVSNSPHGGDAADVCMGATLADGAAMACDSLLYYVTQVPTSEEGLLYGSLELSDANGWAGHTSSVASDLASTPEFEPGLDAYELPASGVDDLGAVACG